MASSQIPGGAYSTDRGYLTGQVIFTATSAGTLRLRNYSTSTFTVGSYPSSTTNDVAADSGTNASLLIVKLS
jgi:hypothetical protein